MENLKKPYTFCTLRYIHDVIAGECINIGVLVYAPEHQYVGARFIKNYERLMAFFPGANEKHLRKVMDSLDCEFREFPTEHFYPRYVPAENIAVVLGQILPVDDSSLQFSEPGGGLTDNPEATLGMLFERYTSQVVRYVETDTH